MPSDISRYTFDSKKHYSGVIEQQGRVRLDADANEQLKINQYRTHTETVDVIGKSGVPKGSNAFKISIDQGSFTIYKGRFYSGGLLCELEDTINYSNQPYYPNPPYLKAPNSPPVQNPKLKLDNGTYIVYIDAWQREVSHLDDPDIQEVALGEVDTTTRLQTVWQVKLVQVENNFKCNKTSIKWKKATKPSTGKLRVKTVDNATAVAPCTPFSSTGFRGLENQLYRIEIQKSGSINNATYKWSRENGSVETLIYSVDGSTLKVQSTGKDDVLGFAAGQWCEIVNDYSTFHNIPYPLVKIKEVKNATKEILLDPSSSIPSFNDQEVFKLRRWDHQSDSNDGDIPLKTNWVDIEAGIQVKFDNGHYKTGDFWLVEARTLTNDIKLRSSDNGEALGIQHQYAQLAVLKVNNGNLILVDDCRSQFPPLTYIFSTDIG
ncbi:MAG: DUF6519 domain-containing protein, partial [Bacteroidota bacterium]